MNLEAGKKTILGNEETGGKRVVLPTLTVAIRLYGKTPISISGETDAYADCLLR